MSASFNVAHWRFAEESAVLSIELAGTFIADFEGRCCGIETFMKHAFARDVQPEMLLVLKRAHCCEGTEVMVERGHAHLRNGGKFLDPQRSGVILAQPSDSPGGPVALLS